MIKGIINNALQSNSRLLDESKDKIVAAAKKRSQSQFGDKVPNPYDLKNQLEALRSEKTTPEQIVKAEQVFNKFLSLCDKVINKIDATIKELTNINSKLDKINENFTKIQERISVLQPIVTKLQTASRALGFSLLALNTFTGITGKQVKDLSDLIDSIKDKLTEFSSLVIAIPQTVDYYQKEVNKLKPPVEKGISSLEALKSSIETLKNLLISLYTAFIASLQFPEYDGYTEDEIQDEIEDNINDNEGSSNTITTLNTQLGTYFILTTRGERAIKYEYKKLKI